MPETEISARTWIDGFGDLERVMQDLAFTDAEIVDVEKIGAQIIADIASELAPVKTGFLSEHISVEVVGGEVFIKASADYAQYVEYGTSKMAAQPFLRPAAEQGSEEAVQAMRDEIFQEIAAKTNG